MNEFNWIKIARSKIGTKEIKGKQHNGVILQMWKAIKRGGIKDDETAWCAAFVGSCLEESGLVSTRFEGASSYLKWGEQCKPCYGAVVLLSTTYKAGTGYHVGFLVGHDNAGNVFVLGGNQNNEVNVSKFSLSRVKATRWPSPVFNPKQELPILNGAGLDFSTSEA